MIGWAVVAAEAQRRGVTRLDGEAVLRRAYTAHGAELFRMAARSLGDRGLAEEVVQETFVRAWRAQERFDADRSSLRTWLFAIARNLVIDAARARSVRPQVAGEVEETHRVDDDPTEQVVVAMQIEEALGRISPEHRQVLVEVHYRGRPHAEVAQELGVALGTVRSRVYYGLRALKLALEEMGWSDD